MKKILFALALLCSPSMAGDNGSTITLEGHLEPGRTSPSVENLKHPIYGCIMEQRPVDVLDRDSGLLFFCSHGCHIVLEKQGDCHPYLSCVQNKKESSATSAAKFTTQPPCLHGEILDFTCGSKSKPLPTRWIVVEAHEGCKRTGENSFICPPPPISKSGFIIDMDRSLRFIEIGLQDDGQGHKTVVWR